MMATASSPPRTLSIWAGVAFVSSLLIFCPLATMAAPVLGVLALRDLKQRPHRMGRGFAIAAIVIGALVTLAYGVMAVGWNANVRRPLLAGPLQPMRAGLAGQIEPFQSGFVDGTQVAAADAEVFLAAVRERFGELIAIQQDRSDTRPIEPDQFDPYRMVVPYRFDFSRGPVLVDAEFVAGDGPMSYLTNALPGQAARPRWGFLRIADAERGDLIYPPGAVVEDRSNEP